MQVIIQPPSFIETGIKVETIRDRPVREIRCNYSHCKDRWTRSLNRQRL